MKQRMIRFVTQGHCYSEFRRLSHCQSHKFDFVVQNVSSQNGAGGLRRTYRASPCRLRDAPVNGGSGHGFSSFFSNHSSSPSLSLESESFLGSYNHHVYRLETI